MSKENQYRIVLRSCQPSMDRCGLCDWTWVELLHTRFWFFIDGTDTPVCDDCVMEYEPELEKLRSFAIALEDIESRIADAKARAKAETTAEERKKRARERAKVDAEACVLPDEDETGAFLLFEEDYEELPF